MVATVETPEEVIDERIVSGKEYHFTRIEKMMRYFEVPASSLKEARSFLEENEYDYLHEHQEWIGETKPKPSGVENLYSCRLHGFVLRDPDHINEENHYSERKCRAVNIKEHNILMNGVCCRCQEYMDSGLSLLEVRS